MRREDTRAVLAYFFGIPIQRKLLDRERTELEAGYDGLHGTPMDGLPHSSTPGNPTESLALRMDALGAADRLKTLSVCLGVLGGDRDRIQGCLDLLNGEYKRLIFMRGQDRYSWAKIAVQLSTSERTAQRRYDRAVDRLGELLEETPMVDEILHRALYARG